MKHFFTELALFTVYAIVIIGVIPACAVWLVVIAAGCSVDRRPMHAQCFSGSTVMLDIDVDSGRSTDDGKWRLVDTKGEVIVLTGNCLLMRRAAK